METFEIEQLILEDIDLFNKLGVATQSSGYH